MPEHVSVIIPTYNSFSEKQGSLHLTLLSLSRQDIYGHFDVVVVDNGSSDRTQRYLQSVAPRLFPQRIHWSICKETGNRSMTRNLGVDRSGGEVIVFMDDDVILPDPATLRKAVATLGPCDSSFACGARRRWMDRHWDATQTEAAILRSDTRSLRNASFLPRGISRESGYRDLQEFSFVAHFGLISRGLLKRTGGFDAELFPSRREDVDLMYRLVLHGAEYVHLHDVCECIHLTHPMAESDPYARIRYQLRFQDRERACGYSFRVNHLFGIDEGAGGSVLEPIEARDV